MQFQIRKYVALWLAFLAIIAATAYTVGVTYAGDLSVSTGVIGSAGYVYSIQGTPTGCVITTKNGSAPLYILARYNGMEEKWSDEVKTLEFPTDKASVPMDLYWGSKPTGVYTKLTAVVMEKNTKTGNWEVHTENEVYTANAEVLGSWTDDMSGNPSSAVAAISNQVCAGITDDYKKALAIHDWVCSNIYYNRDDQGYDIIKDIDPDKVLSEKLAHCGGYAELFQAMCHAQNIPCVTVYGTTSESGSLLAAVKNPAAKIAVRFWTHGWNECYADGRWLIVDCTWDSGLEVRKGVKYDNNVSHAYFDCDLTFFSATHLALSRSGTQTEAPALWSKNQVLAAMQNDLLPEELNGRFGTAITRGEFCALAVRLVEQKEAQPIKQVLANRGLTQGSFTDTSNPNILAANALGIVSGYKDGRFNPDGRISRQEAAAILMRTAKVLGVESTAKVNTFSDKAQAGEWAHPAIAFVSDKGIMQGVGDNCFVPKGGYTREQSIVTIMRLFDLS